MTRLDLFAFDAREVEEHAPGILTSTWHNLGYKRIITRAKEFSLYLNSNLSTSDILIISQS